jgi:hypothetical protein
MANVRTIFHSAKKHAERFVGKTLDLHFMYGWVGEFPEKRDYAYCSRIDHDTTLIVVAPKMKLANANRAKAVIRHEIGHALDFLIPRREVDSIFLSRGLYPISTPERRADKLAEIIWDHPIYYDDQLVQTLSEGIKPRPKHLGL